MKPKNYRLVQNGFMEKLTCNQNLALSANAPWFLGKVQEGFPGARAAGRGAPVWRAAGIVSSNPVQRPPSVRAQHSAKAAPCG